MIYQKRRLSAIVCMLTLILCGGCARNSGGDFCLIYQPIYTSVEDTEQTQDQVDINNAVWQELCSL
jgi:hypothetical protein